MIRSNNVRTIEHKKHTQSIKMIKNGNITKVSNTGTENGE